MAKLIARLKELTLSCLDVSIKAMFNRRFGLVPRALRNRITTQVSTIDLLRADATPSSSGSELDELPEPSPPSSSWLSSSSPPLPSEGLLLLLLPARWP